MVLHISSSSSLNAWVFAFVYYIVFEVLGFNPEPCTYQVSTLSLRGSPDLFQFFKLETESCQLVKAGFELGSLPSSDSRVRGITGKCHNVWLFSHFGLIGNSYSYFNFSTVQTSLFNETSSLGQGLSINWCSHSNLHVSIIICHSPNTFSIEFFFMCQNWIHQ